MALNWTISRIEDYDNFCWQRHREPIEGFATLTCMAETQQWNWSKDNTYVYRLNPVTNALIWGTMSIGIGEITQKNHEEVFLRYEMLRRIQGASMWKRVDGEEVDRPFTLADIKRHIGLGTNVSELSKAKFKNRLAEELRLRAENTLKHQRESAEEAA